MDVAAEGGFNREVAGGVAARILEGGSMTTVASSSASVGLFWASERFVFSFLFLFLSALPIRVTSRGALKFYY